jgi:hypothetical protein
MPQFREIVVVTKSSMGWRFSSIVANSNSISEGMELNVALIEVLPNFVEINCFVNRNNTKQVVNRSLTRLDVLSSEVAVEIMYFVF